MAARSYIYLDTAVSSTVLQVTTSPTTAHGANKVTVAVAVNSTDKAEFLTYQGTGNRNILVDNIAANSISTNEFISNTAQIKNLIVTTAKIDNLAITTAKIAALAVTTAEIGALAVTTAKIAALAVTTAEIGNLAVTTAKINALAVTTAEIGNLAVTTAKINALAVTTAEIAALAVTDAKIDTLTVAKLTAGIINSKIITLDFTDTAGDVAIRCGKTDFGNDVTSGFIFGIDDSVVGNPVKFEMGSSATKIFKYDGTDVTLIGGTITAGTVRTSSTNPRVELSGVNNRLDIYNSAGANIASFGSAGVNGNILTVTQTDTNEDFPPVYITSAQDSNVISVTNTNASLANRPAFRFDSNNVLS